MLHFICVAATVMFRMLYIFYYLFCGSVSLYLNDALIIHSLKHIEKAGGVGGYELDLRAVVYQILSDFTIYFFFGTALK